jgi:3-hydroxyacyl-[acyl-carrier-protein] dehydratase
MLQNDLFTFNDFISADNSIQASVEINWSHPIFEGHFPGMPIFPGVCMMQMVKEAVENYLGKPVKLTKAADLKFLVMVQPQNTIVQLELKVNVIDSAINADARLLDSANVFFKFKGTFTEK